MILYLFYCFHVIYDDSDLQANNKNNNNCDLVVLYNLVSSSNIS